jgi:hypothetical protein
MSLPLFAVFAVKNSGDLAVISLFRFQKVEGFCGLWAFPRCFRCNNTENSARGARFPNGRRHSGFRGTAGEDQAARR